MRRCHSRVRWAESSRYPVAAMLVLVGARIAGAACDLILHAQQAFRAALGTVNRPFASRGDVLEIDIRPTLCDGTSPSLQPLASDHVVALVFQPPLDKVRHMVI